MLKNYIRYWRVVLGYCHLYLVYGKENNANKGPTDSEVLQETFKKYNKHRASSWDLDKPAEVHVWIYLESMSDLKESRMSFDVDMYLQESWMDERLSHNLSYAMVITDMDLVKKMWKPDLYFANSKRTQLHYVTSPNHVLEIYPNGLLHYNMRVSGTFSCQQDLRFYPVDKQECHIRLLSYAHPVEKITLHWYPESAFDYSPEIKLPEMKITSTTVKTCNTNYTKVTEKPNKLTLAEYSCLEASIRVQRQIGYHLVQTYIPSIMIVCVSWISFWIDPFAVPARITLSFTTLLVLTTQAAGVRMSLPPVSYAKAIDYWMGLCMMMVFAALLEYTIVNSLIQKGSRLLQKQQMPKPDTVGEHLVKRLLPPQAEFELNNIQIKRWQYQARSYQKAAHRIEWVSRFLFPITFALINIAYWCIVLNS